jgi:ABC-type uncharacterized transport system substrate-binding protein
VTSVEWREQGKHEEKNNGPYACAMLFALGFSAEAQQRPNSLKIGYLAITSRAAESPTRMEAFRKGLSDLGYQEGKNFVIESRYAEGDLDWLFAQARDLVGLQVDIIVAADIRAARVAMKASATIPIVLASGRDPVEAGVVASLLDRAETLLD